MRLSILLIFLATNSLPAGVAEFWFYKSANLLVPEQVEETVQLLKRAGRAGYTHCLLTDSKFSRLGQLPERYFTQVRQVQAAAAEAQVELVPALFPIGYSNDLLSQDPNLAEGLPVRDCVLTVHDGVAMVDAALQPVLRGGDFTEGIKGWGWKDDSIILADGVATSQEPAGKNSRICQKLTLRPWQQYHLSVRARSQHYDGKAEVKLISESGRTLNYDFLKVAPTQDWQVHHVVFNSQEHTQVNLYLGCWDGQHGEMSWDDVKLELCPFVNLVRRPQAPLRVQTASGKVLMEGQDFEPLSDPLLGSQPYAGCFTIYHQPPVLRTKLPEGTPLQVSYYHAVTVYDDQANLCVSEPKTLELLKDQAMRVHALFHAKGYLMAHDEIRVFNWSELPGGRKVTAGELLAENARACTQLLREVNPGGRIYVWGDMFDPNHNARNQYYLVNGDLSGSWEGLDAEVIVVPWAFEFRDKSMAFHASRGHHQVLAGYYDQPQALNAAAWIQSAAHVEHVDGIMFTTWENHYESLEAFKQQAR